MYLSCGRQDCCSCRCTTLHRLVVSRSLLVGMCLILSHVEKQACAAGSTRVKHSVEPILISWQYGPAMRDSYFRILCTYLSYGISALSISFCMDHAVSVTYHVLQRDSSIRPSLCTAPILDATKAKGNVNADAITFLPFVHTIVSVISKVYNLYKWL